MGYGRSILPRGKDARTLGLLPAPMVVFVVAGSMGPLLAAAVFPSELVW